MNVKDEILDNEQPIGSCVFSIKALSLKKIWDQMRSFSISCCKDWICGFSCDPSCTVTEQAITERETPQARPSAKKRMS
jgi:hypothetical protein